MSTTGASATKARPRRSAGTATRPRRRKRAPRWDGLDAARGLTVLGAAVLATGAVLAPESLGPTSWLGLRLIDLVPAVFLVVAGAGLGWRVDTRETWPAPRGRRRALLLVGFGLGIAVARAGGDPSLLAPDELLRLIAALGVARLVLKLPKVWVVLFAVIFALVPSALTAVDPFGRGLRTVEPTAAFSFESAVGLSAGGVPVVSFTAAVALVLAGVAFGTWAHRRPPGPATAAALATVGVWCLLGTLVVGQVIAPVPLILDLPVALAGIGAAAIVLAVGHVVAGRGALSVLQVVGRTALPIVVAGTLALASLPADGLPQLPTLAALTVGCVVAAGAVVVAQRLDATRWTWRA